MATVRAIIFLCISSYLLNISVSVISFGRKTYVVCSIRNDTSLRDFKELFKYYMKIQTSCSDCIPPTYGLPATFLFGSINKTMEIRGKGQEVIDRLQHFYDNEFAIEAAYMSSKSGVVNNETKKSEQLGRQLDSVVDEIISADLNNMTLKTVIILTDYFSPESYSILHQLNDTFLPFTTQSFTVTNINITTNVTEVLTESSNATQIDNDSRRLLNSSIVSPMACELNICKVAFFFDFFHHDYDYIGRMLEAKFEDPNILFLNETEHMPFSIFVCALIHKGNVSQTIYVSSPWMGTNDTLQYLQQQTWSWASAGFMGKDAFFYRMAREYILGSNGVVNSEQISYVAIIADDLPVTLIDNIRDDPSKPVSRTHNVDLVIVTDHTYVDPTDIYQYVTEIFLVLPSNTSKYVGNHVIGLNRTNDTFEWMTEYGIFSSVAASADLRPITHEPVQVKAPSNSTVTIVCSILGGLLLLVLIGAVIMYWNKRRRRRQKVLNVQEMKTHDEDHLDSLRIASGAIDIDYGEVVGKGSTSMVYQALLKTSSPLHRQLNHVNASKFNNCKVAVKVPTSFNYVEFLSANRELEAFKRLRHHEHILACLGWMQLESRKCLVFELALGGDLRQYVMSLRDQPAEEFNEKEFLYIFRQICLGMAYVASCKMVHRDLAARNVLLTADKRAKISDFGLCCDCDETFTYTATLSKRLPIRWLSLEALVDRVFSEKSDVWSFGVLLYEVFSKGVTPYAALSNGDIVDYLRSGERLERAQCASEHLYALMCECWLEDLLQRPTFEALARTFEQMLEKSSEHYGYLIA